MPAIYLLFDQSPPYSTTVQNPLMTSRKPKLTKQRISEVLIFLDHLTYLRRN